MQIYLGSDHGGFVLKNQIKEYLVMKSKSDEDSKVLDLGVFTNDSTDYLDIEREICEKVVENPGSIGIVFSSKGEDVCNLANKMDGIKAMYVDKQMATVDLTTNFLCFPAKVSDFEMMKKVMEEFIYAKH